ncbi:hypothetical protein [Spongiibacter sp. UBA1325]|uniref:hypothetical protein n=1 Tax=Spongiibacter sp. UBA1325 TaxID=1947543 RepID=UPI00257A16F8|nr:hypothetical protein [Spongiibacter sp. UBA1325]|tara:strand:- start:11184 stop:12659 length:1476 start_codon:yes stop_codon:yes gene_type:complete
MTITRDQIVLAESQVMADTDDGGGRMSGEVVEEGAINNTMPDVSRLDRVYGRVNMRKLFLSVRAPNQDTLLGAHSILLRQPADPRVAVSLFQTGSHTDRRVDARDRIESYLVKSSEANFWLWGDHLESQRGLAALQRLDAVPPEPGEVYCLISDDGSKEQYVRITDVTVGRETFTVQVGAGFQTFELQTLQISLANSLDVDFMGSDPYPTGRHPGTAKVLITQVADAARYFGAAKLSAAGAPGDLTAQVDSVYTNLVPSAQSETPLTDRNGGPGRLPVVPADDATISVNADDVNEDTAGYAVYYTGRGFVPGTLQITGSNGTYDDAGGQLEHSSGSDRLDASDLDYQNGIVRIKWTSSSYKNNPITLTFQPGAAFSQQAYSYGVEIEIQNRSLTYVNQLRPIPAPGTLIFEFMALGRWNTLADRGDGILEGAGTGQINYATGTVETTLSALPDVGPEIIYSWGDDQSFDIADGSGTAPVSEVVFNATDVVV